MADSMDTDEDDVVAEYDVQLVAVHNMYQLQFPLESAGAADASCAIDCRYKERMQRLSMTVQLDTQSSNFNDNRAQDLARLSLKAQASMPASSRIDKQRLMANIMPDSDSRNAILYYENGRFCVTPLRGTYSLRPVTDYMNAAEREGDAKTPAEVDRAGTDSQSESDAEGSSTPAAQAIRVKFGRDESAIPKTARRRHETQADRLKRLDESDAWMPMTYHRLEAEIATRRRAKLLRAPEKMETSEEPSGAAGDCKLATPIDIPLPKFIRTLCPEPCEQTTSEEVDSSSASTSTDHVTLDSIKALTIDQQITQLFKRVHVFTWSEMKSRLRPTDLTDEAILEAVQNAAILVMGSWVLKSELAYPVGYQSPYTGCTHEPLRKARDFVLYSFDRSAVVRSNVEDKADKELITRAMVLTATHIPEPDADAILRQVGSYRPYKGWWFIKAPNTLCTDRFPEIVEKYAKFWEERWHTLQQWVRENALAAEAAAALKSATSTIKRRRVSSQRASRRSRCRTESTSTMDAKSMISPPTSPNRQTSQPTQKSVGHMSPPPTNRLQKSASPSSTGRNNLSNGTSPSANGSLPSTETIKNNFQAFIERAFTAQRVLTVGGLRDKMLATSVDEGGDILKLMLDGSSNDVPAQLLVDTLKGTDWLTLASSAVKKRGSAAGSEPPSTTNDAVSWSSLFIDSRGENQPDLRAQIVTFLSTRKSQRFRLNTIKNHITVPPDCNDAQLMNIMRDYCTNTSGLYQLIGDE